jgi:hypothetical protein
MFAHPSGGQGGQVNFDLSRSDVEILLAEFLTGAAGVQLTERLTDLNALPAECCNQVRPAEASGRICVAWSSSTGPIAAWGDYHVEGSKQLKAYLMSVEWYDAQTGHHSLSC